MIPQYQPQFGKEEKEAMMKYLDSGGYLTEHKQTEKFEQMLAEFLGVKYVSLVPNGTVALYLALLASGVKEGDEVLVPDFTMIATPNAVTMAGGIPDLVDIEKDSFCLNLNKVALNPATKAMIYVSINGRSGNLHEVKRFCKENNLALIEDACQSLGSRYKGRYIGTFGRFGCFSLSFHKIISTGQGGFIVTHNRKDYETIERLKDFGRLKGGADIHPGLGFNFKFTDLQAVIGIEQLKKIEWHMEKKRQLHKWYTGFEPMKGWVPWFIELVGIQRNKIAKRLADYGVATRSFYPPIHTQPIYRYNNGSYPTTESVSRMGLWLPSSFDLDEKTVTKIRRVYAYFQRH